MNTFKKNGGFTLVELIIVIAILAILSTVAVAGYSSYITKANDSAAESFLNDLKTHVALANAKGGAVTAITVDETGAVTATVESVSPDFQEDFSVAYGIDEDAITIDGNTITFSVGDKLPNTWTASNYGKNKGASWSNNEWAVVK